MELKIDSALIAVSYVYQTLWNFTVKTNCKIRQKSVVAKEMHKIAKFYKGLIQDADIWLLGL